MKKFFNDLIGITGYQIKNKKYLYDPNKNLIKTIKHFQIKSIIDVGANKGQFALRLLKNNFDGNIMSFEPLKEEYKTLNELSLERENWKVARRCALGNKNEFKKFHISGNRESSSLLKILEKHTDLRPESKTIKTEKVNVERLDNFKKEISKLEKNLLLKIDTQGSEIDVLKGASKVIKDIKCLFVEVSLVPLYKNQKLWLDIIKYMKKLNFNVWSVDQLLKNNTTGQTYQVDLFFYKKK
tara:strand:+ start:200 stop:919 length:720 start_codon:yes stop_codon:yes gene_type:complete